MDSILELFDDLKSIADNERDIDINKLMVILKTEASKMTMKDLMDISVLLREDFKYVQEKYRNHYLELYVKNFLLRTKEIKKDTEDYSNTSINKQEFLEAIAMLEAPIYDEEIDYEEQYDKSGGEYFQIVYVIISLYTTFILNEPIHPVGTTFPGGSKVRLMDDTYFCPVRDAQSKSPNAVCGFCIAQQDDI